MPKPYLVPALKRGFDIIEYLAASDAGLTISDIHRALKLPLSSAATILYTLESLGYIERSGEDSRYSLSMKLLGISRGMDQADMVGRCHDLLEQLVTESGLTGHLAVLRDSKSMYVDRVPAPGLMQVSSYVGMTWPIHSSAAGKALLAFLDLDELKQKLAAIDLTKFTTHTLGTKSALERQLARFKALGYTWEVNEGEVGVGCVAAPIYGPGPRTGFRVIAAASVTGTTTQITPASIPRLGKLVKNFAQRMSERLGANMPS